MNNPTDSELRQLQVPLTELEAAELTKACLDCLSPAGMMLLRRLLFELNERRAKEDKFS